MRRFKTASAALAVLGLTAGFALAQNEPGFGGHGDVSKNQIPGPNPSGNPTDPAAGNPGSPAQIPTAPEKQENLENKGDLGVGAGETGTDIPAPPPQ